MFNFESTSCTENALTSWSIFEVWKYFELDEKAELEQAYLNRML